MSKVYTNVPDGLRDLLRLAAGPADEAGELDVAFPIVFSALFQTNHGNERGPVNWHSCECSTSFV